MLSQLHTNTYIYIYIYIYANMYIEHSVCAYIHTCMYAQMC